MPSKQKKAPEKLASKLLAIREELGLSQSEMVRRLGVETEINRGKISEYERGQRIPPLHILLAYARSKNLTVESLIDDNIDIWNMFITGFEYRFRQIQINLPAGNSTLCIFFPRFQNQSMLFDLWLTGLNFVPTYLYASLANSEIYCFSLELHQVAFLTLKLYNIFIVTIFISIVIKLI